MLDGDPAPPKRAQHPEFLAMSVVAKRLDDSRYHLLGRYRPWPGDIVLDEDPAPPPKRGGGTAALHFSAHLYGGQTANRSR